MKPYLPPLFITGALLVVAPGPIASARYWRSEAPTAIQRNVAAREKVATAKKTLKLEKAGSHKTKKGLVKMNRTLLVLLRMEESKRVTTPKKLDRQLHLHQQQLQIKARQAARSRRARCAKQMN